MNKNRKEENLLSTLVSISVPLIQVIAVTTIALRDQLNLTKYFIRSDALPLVNTFSILLILSAIGIISTLQYVFISSTTTNNLIVLIWKKFREWIVTLFKLEQVDAYVDKREAIVKSMNSIFFFLQTPSLIGLYLTIFVHIPVGRDFLGFIQVAIYTIFLVSSGVLIYIWVSEYIRRKSFDLPEHYYSNLQEALRREGIIEEPTVRVIYTIFNVGNGGDKLLKVSVGKEVWYLHMDFAQKLTRASWRSDEVPSNIKKIFDDQLEPSADTL